MLADPACAFAQPAHQRFFPSAGSPKDAYTSWHTSHFFFLLFKFADLACAFAHPPHMVHQSVGLEVEPWHDATTDGSCHW